jgi:glutathione S-transferase
MAVDLKSHRTHDGRDYTQINPTGYVPALVFDDGQVLTENCALLTWIADQASDLGVSGPLGRYHLLEILAYISTELHKAFRPFFSGGTDDAKKAASETITKRLAYLAARLKGDYLFGSRFTVADAYLFVMLTWAQKTGVPIPAALQAFQQRVAARPAVQRTLAAENPGQADAAKAS